jgi:signal transduction histidine kinase
VTGSIRRRLLVSLTAAIAVATVSLGAWQYRHALAQSDAQFDFHLRQLALTLRDQVLAQPEAPLVTRTERDVVVQVWDAAGEHDWTPRPGATLPRLAQPGFGDVDTPDGRWRAYAAAADGRMIQVGQPHALREAAAARVAFHALAAPLAVGALLVALAWWVVGRSLRPVARLAGTVGARRPDDLRPIGPEGLPAEVAPLVGAFDALLARLAAAQDAQRALIADAAHALRSPLTALSLQLQALERGDAGAEARERLRAGVDRATRLVEQLLALARSEAAGDRPDAADVRLDELARAALAAALPLADARGTDLGLVHADAVAVRGDPDALGALVANLVDNAIRHSGDAAQVDVAVRRDGALAVLEVEDSGPGIPPAERARVLERFGRGRGAAPNGTGLGLAIVRTAVERHGGTLALGDSRLGGLAVRVVLPLVEPTAAAA